MTTPKSLTDLRYQEFVFETKPGQDPAIIARKWFRNSFEVTDEPKMNLLFTEDGRRVYESYIDSGSVDYIYIIAR